jgi:16S rRNA (uracil1498-N3)-methyltransferase
LTSKRFFIKEKPSGSAHLFLEGSEHHHLSKVARIKPGEKVWLFDEHGNRFMARVEAVEKDRTLLNIVEEERKRVLKVRITLAQALLKTKKMDLVVQKATELGAYAIVPLLSERTVVKIENKQDKKMERWKRVVLEAAKQSGSTSVPEIHPPTELMRFISGKEKSKKMFLSERGGESLRDILMFPLNEKLKIPDSVNLLIGPEGGWTEKEEQDIMSNSYEAVSLGTFTLRSETAAIASLAMVSHFWMHEDVP